MGNHISLCSDHFIATPVGMVHYGVETLVRPLPDDDSQRVPMHVRTRTGVIGQTPHSTHVGSHL